MLFKAFMYFYIYDLFVHLHLNFMIKRIILTPFQKFVKIESLSGILLFSATLIAMIWANSGLVIPTIPYGSIKLVSALKLFSLQNRLFYGSTTASWLYFSF